MNTEAITPLVSTMSTADYTLARYASLIGIFTLGTHLHVIPFFRVCLYLKFSNEYTV